MSASRPTLGLLDFGELTLGETASTAGLAEELGYARFWLAEHFGLIENALLVTSLIAAATQRIRVGPAGVLLRYYAAASVAYDAIFLERLFQRVDLGIAGARFPAGADEMLLDGRTDVHDPAAFERKLEALAARVSAHAEVSERPEVWLLGSSDSRLRAQSAARLHAHFSLSLMHSVEPPSPAPIRAFREEEARLGLAPGRTTVAIQLACVESPRERPESPHAGLKGRAFIEVPRLCRERIEEIRATYGVDEVTVLEASRGAERRDASIRMLAEAFGGLDGPPEKGRVPSPATI